MYIVVWINKNANLVYILCVKYFQIRVDFVKIKCLPYESLFEQIKGKVKLKGFNYSL